MKKINLCLSIAVLIQVFLIQQTLSVPKLQTYNADLNETSVSGLSTGGVMTVQFQYAYSSFIKGAGVISGVPYNCATDNPGICCVAFGNPNIIQSIATINSRSGISIDNTFNLQTHKVFMIHGTADIIVGQQIMDQLYNQYLNFIPASNINYTILPGASHTLPTDFYTLGDNPCPINSLPCVSDCGFDAPGAILNYIYGNNLNPRNNANNTGTFIEFDQSEFLDNILNYGLSTSGYIYVPNSCASQKCKLHVALHGCLQMKQLVGFQFIKGTGYDKWADTNNFIILFPQTSPITGTLSNINTTNLMGSSFDTNNLLNSIIILLAQLIGIIPEILIGRAMGCWDWYGMYGSDYNIRTGVHISTIKKMIDRIVGN